MQTARINLFTQPSEFLAGLIKNEVYVKKSGLDPKLLEILKFRVSQINDCAYCLDMHYKEATKIGEDPQRLYSLSAWKECNYYSPAERTVLEFAEGILNGNVSPDLYQRLLEFFADDEIATLTLAVATTNSWNILNKTFCTTAGTYQQTS